MFFKSNFAHTGQSTPKYAKRQERCRFNRGTRQGFTFETLEGRAHGGHLDQRRCADA